MLTGWISDEFWLISTKAEQDLMYELTQAVAKRRREEGRQRADEDVQEPGGHDADHDGAGYLPSGDGGQGDRDADHAAGGRGHNEDAAVANFDDEIQKGRLLRMISNMEMQVAHIQRGLTWIRRQLD